MFSARGNPVDVQQSNLVVLQHGLGVIMEGKNQRIIVIMVMIPFTIPPMSCIRPSYGGVISGGLPMIFCIAVWLPEFSLRWNARMGLSFPLVSRQFFSLPE